MLNPLLNLFWPQSCCLCETSGAFLCARCAQELQYISPEASCQICSKPFHQSATAHICSTCQQDPPHYDRHRAPLKYNAKSKELIHALKYKAHFAVQQTLPNLFKICATTFKDVDLIIPIPLHRQRLKQRGFNQSLLLAKLWGRVLDKKVLRHNLIRVIDTRSQTGLGKDERKTNLKEAFQLKDPKILRAKNILLVDDVHTTGVTLNSAARVLKKSNVGLVYATTIAFVEGR